MRSRVEIVAEARDGRPVLARLAAEGQLAVRPTGPDRVHLVGAAAGPLTGDRLDVAVHVRAGARLAVHGVAATLAQPGGPGSGDGPAVVRVELVVEEGGVLRWEPPPTVVCRGADVDLGTTVRAAESAAVILLETLVLGRHAEPAGRWRSRLDAEVAGRPVLRSATSADLIGPGPDGTAPRVVVTRLRLGPGGSDRSGRSDGSAAVRGCAVRMPLAAGGFLVTAVGPDAVTVHADVDSVDPDSVDPDSVAGQGTATLPSAR